MRWFVATFLILLVGCGSSRDGTSLTQSGDLATRGCGPLSATTQFGAFLDAVSARDREAALRFVAPRSKLLVVTLYHGAQAGAGRVSGKSPAAVYGSFAKTIARGEATQLVAVGVGTAPFEAPYAERGGGRTLGVELAARIGARALSGKIGIDCSTGQMYV